MSLRAQLLQTARAYVDAHNSRDMAAIKSLCSDDCTHKMGPSSVPAPERDNAAYVAFNDEVLRTMDRYHATVTSTAVDDEARKVVLWVRAAATAAAGEYENEYLIELTMTEDGRRVWAQFDFSLVIEGGVFVPALSLSLSTFVVTADAIAGFARREYNLGEAAQDSKNSAEDGGGV